MMTIADWTFACFRQLRKGRIRRLCHVSGILTAFLLLTLSATRSAYAQTDADRIEQCRQAVLNCQLEDGAIVAVAYPGEGSSALVEPYFSDLACCGILAAEQMKPDPRNRQFIEKWLKWYALREREDGKIVVLSGKRGPQGLVDVTPNAPDSLDSYSAMYLYVAGRYSTLTHTKLEPDVAEACVRLLNVLESCQDTNGLYWNFPTNYINTPQGHPLAEYLSDDIEAYMGLREIAEPLEESGFFIESNYAKKSAEALAAKLTDFWSPKQDYYVCIFGDLAANVPFGAQPANAAALATVAALAQFDNVPDARRRLLWERMQKVYGSQMQAGYQTANYSAEDPTIENVYRAALRSASDDELEVHHNLLRRRIDTLLARNRRLRDPQARADNNPFPYCHRFGMMLIALASPRGKATPYLPNVPLPSP